MHNKMCIWRLRIYPIIFPSNRILNSNKISNTTLAYMKFCRNRNLISLNRAQRHQCAIRRNIHLNNTALSFRSILQISIRTRNARMCVWVLAVGNVMFAYLSTKTIDNHRETFRIQLVEIHANRQKAAHRVKKKKPKHTTFSLWSHLHCFVRIRTQLEKIHLNVAVCEYCVYFWIHRERKKEKTTKTVKCFCKSSGNCREWRWKTNNKIRQNWINKFN